MSEPLTPERIADLRQWRAASREPRLPDDERKARTMEFLRRLEFAAPALLATAEEAATLRAERDKLRRLLDLACEDESEIHRRLDAVLPPDMMLTAKPLMGGRTPLCGDDGRVAQLVAENARLRAEHDAALTAKAQAGTYAADIEGCLESIARVVTGGPETAGIVNKVEALADENTRLRDLPHRVQDRWMPIDTAPKNGTFIITIIDGIHEETGERFLPSVARWHPLNCDGEVLYGWHDPDATDEDVFNIYRPTHWRALPPTPAEESELDALRAQNEEALVAENVKLRSLLARVKRVLPPGELYESILSVLHEETPCASETLVEAISRELRESR